MKSLPSDAVEQPDRPLGQRHAQLAVVHQRLDERHGGEGAEDHQRPGPHRHRRPVLEDQALLARRRVDQHVPEAQRLAQVEREQDRAGQQRGEGDVVADPGGRLVGPADQPQQRGERVRPAGEAAEEEVEQDVPRPVGPADEVLGVFQEQHGHALSGSAAASTGSGVGSRRRRSAMRPPMTATTAGDERGEVPAHVVAARQHRVRRVGQVVRLRLVHQQEERVEPAVDRRRRRRRAGPRARPARAGRPGAAAARVAQLARPARTGSTGSGRPWRRPVPARPAAGRSRGCTSARRRCAGPSRSRRTGRRRCSRGSRCRRRAGCRPCRTRSG